ncbi:DUF2853 family protein [Sphingorhabdus sp. Alg239-R122]|uniref:DUF2853 family protein n=1 Tax=Sphingorhabdus sp. Alg239-R122 TaxID=2305989 RepID=UPI0013D9FF1D|nr:DUF2853 family protein [Sphingorhabdus sp. Alg239-R122]
MAENWTVNVKKYAPDAIDSVIDAIVKHCGIALQNRDSSLVSFSDTKETDRVRESFLKKKLGLTHPDTELDAAIAAVGERMSDDTTKNRVTVYYLLTELFGKLDIFGGTAGSYSAAGLAGATAAGAAAAGMASSATAADTDSSATYAEAEPVHATSEYHHEEEESGGLGWLLWLLLAAALAGLLYWLFTRDNNDAVQGADDNVPAESMPATAPGSTVIPEGAGVVSELRDEKPAVIVYFDTGKAEVAPEFADEVAAMKAYVDANADAELAVSGYNDPTGNAELNAELSKSRAQAVQAALVTAGVPEGSIDLVKPVDTTDEDTDMAQARRVEVTVK